MDAKKTTMMVGLVVANTALTASLAGQGPPLDYWQIKDTAGWWKLDEGTGTFAYDQSKYANHGSCTGTQWILNPPGYALRFDTSLDSGVYVPDAPSLDFDRLGAGEGFMIDFWMRRNQVPAIYSAGLVHKRYYGGYTVNLQTDGRIGFTVDGPGGANPQNLVHPGFPGNAARILRKK